MGRAIVELVLAIGIITAVAVGIYRLAVGTRASGAPRAALPELDVSRTPSSWFTDSRTTEDGYTEICIVRVETKTGLIRERRVLRRLNNTDPGYSQALDEAMDEAYAAMRVANVNLNRR
ncbi:MAG TPA: hypothetical protein VFU35_05460 [Jatrophihabitans sp.]|nr:hypothetical protein [Jatrophihabitans sp.]